MKYVALTDEDHEWLAGQMRKVRRNMYARASESSVEQNERIERVVAAFDDATKVLEPQPDPEPQKQAPKPKRRTKKSRVSATDRPVLARDACREHPKYTAARTPRSDCEGCWAFYKALHPTAYPQAILKFQREQRRKAKKA